MAASQAEGVLVDLRRLVYSLVPQNRILSQQETDNLLVATKKVLEDGFKGSRAVRGHLWNLVNTSGRAFPVCLQPSISKAKALAKQEEVGDDAKVLLWIQEALHQGVLSLFIQKLPTQYHIMSAYGPEAAMCDVSLRAEFEVLLSQLKGLLPSLPDTKPCSSSGSAEASTAEILSLPSSEHHTESSPATTPKQNIPETNVFQRLSQKGLGIPIQWLESHVNQRDENPVCLALHVIDDPEAGQIVRLSINLSQGAGLLQHGSFVSEMAQGFNNVLDTLVKRPSTAEGKSSPRHQESVQDALSDEAAKHVDTHPDKQPTVQNVWGWRSFVKPFVRPGESTPKARGAEGADTSGYPTSPDRDDTYPSMFHQDGIEGDRESVTSTSMASPGAQKNDPPARRKQSGLGFFSSVLGQKATRNTEMISQNEQAKEVKGERGASQSVDTNKPEYFFQSLFRKSTQRSIHNEENNGNTEIAGQELSTIEMKAIPPRASIQELEAELDLGDPLTASLSSEDVMRLSLQMLSPTSSPRLDKAAYEQEKVPMVPEKTETVASNESDALIGDIQSACETLVNEALLCGGAVVKTDCNRIEELCLSIERVLSGCMRHRPRPWRPKGVAGLTFFAGWTSKGHKSPFMVLRNAQQMVNSDVELPAGLGVDVIEGIASVVGDSPQLHAWLISSLNSQCLGQRIEVLSGMDQLWEGWYEEGSLLHTMDGRKRLVNALKGIDDVRCLVAVDRWTGKDEEKGAYGVPAGQAPATDPPVKSIQISEALSSVPSSIGSPTLTANHRPSLRNSSTKHSSRQKKRVIDFDAVAPVAAAPSPFATPELPELPPGFYEGTEPLSTIVLAHALGMGIPEPCEPCLQGNNSIGKILCTVGTVSDSPSNKNVETGETMSSQNVVKDLGSVNRPISVHTTSDAPTEHFKTNLTVQIDDFLGEVDTKGHLERNCTSQVKQTRMNTDCKVSTRIMGAEEKVAMGGLHDSANIPPMDLIRSPDMVAEHALSSMMKGVRETMSLGDELCDKNSSLDELSSSAAEENIQEAIHIAEQEIEQEELISECNERNYLSSVMSLGEEELDMLEPEDLGVSAEDLARSMDKFFDVSSSGRLTGVTNRSVNWEEFAPIDDNQHQVQEIIHDSDAANGAIQKTQESHEGKGIETWDGVWKDIDVLRAETVEETSGTYTVYVLELTASDGTNWQVSRRFRDIVALRRKLMLREDALLPKSWDNVKKSRHITRSSRLSLEIIDARNALMRQCLWDLRSEFKGCLGWEEVASFLDAPLHILKCVKPRTGTITTDDSMASNTRLSEESIGQGPGVVMRLSVDLPTEQSNEALMEEQQGKCAGCFAALPVITSSWGLSSYLPRSSRSKNARKCLYTNRLYCHTCHGNDLEVIPSCVLHNWDFTGKPVCKASKEYLVSIKTKPLLSLVSTNPGMYARVPLLANVQSMRQKVIRTLSIVRAAGTEGEAMAEKLIQDAGNHRHLLEDPDLWSLCDLLDISKGSVFSSLPRWLEAISGKVGRMATSATLKYEDEG